MRVQISLVHVEVKCLGIFESIKYPFCINDILFEETYENRTDCSGSSTSIRVIHDGHCEMWGVKIGIECSTATDTCPDLGIYIYLYSLFFWILQICLYVR